jgi:endonuclease/exonuclease/phosphatase family metal-dependent hydrolase
MKAIGRSRFAALAGWGIALLLAVSAGAETLTIATYNVENYGPANRLTRDGFRRDYPKPEAEKRALRSVIRGLSSDILVLEEMGGEAYLNELRRDLQTEGCSYPYSALALAADAERHVAILSRRPLIGVLTLSRLEFSYFGHPEPVKRGLLLATVRTEVGDLTICAVHLKSRLTERADDPASTIRRIGEATAVRDAILRKFPNPAGVRFVVVGDCNDTTGSKALARLERRGATTITELLPAADPKGEGWTYSYRRGRSRFDFDHVFVSPALHDAVIGGVAHVYAGDDVPDASDHRPVWVSLRLDATAQRRP